MAQYGELLDFLTNNDEMRSTAKSSIKQGLYAGTGAVAGGSLLGPLGGMVGGIVGSIIGYYKSDPYDGAIKTIATLDTARQQALVEEISGILIVAGAALESLETVGGFTSALQQFAAQETVRNNVWQACVTSIN